MADRAHPSSGRGKRSKRGKRRARKKDVFDGISKPALRRLVRRGGISRTSADSYDPSRQLLKTFLREIIRDAVMHTEHARRSTITAKDMLRAFARQGRPIYALEK